MYSCKIWDAIHSFIGKGKGLFQGGMRATDCQFTSTTWGTCVGNEDRFKMLRYFKVAKVQEVHLEAEAGKMG